MAPLTVSGPKLCPFTNLSDLSLHGRKLESIFELLGSAEDDITYSLGWVLAHSPNLLRTF